MKFLRTVSTRRLLAILAGFVSAIAVGAAIAVAASGPCPVPASKPLATAIHDALGAGQVKGITARVQFTNHLIDSTELQGADPLLSGATGRVWLSPSTHQLRLELQSDHGDAQILISKGSIWVSDPSSKTVYEGTLPRDKKPASAAKTDAPPSIAQIQSDITRATQHALLSGAIPSDVAGQPTFTVRVSPRHDGGLLGAGELAWDAVRGVPLRFAVYARNDSTPVLELKATDISYGAVDSSVFAISPPSGSKVVKVNTSGLAHDKASAAKAKAAHKHGKRHTEITGAAAVAKHLPFTLVAPTKLVGLPQRSVSLLDWGGKPAALLTYGQNLGGIMVVEQTADTAKGSTTSTSGRDHRGLNLPTVSINGVTGQELDTALGTMVRFTRAGVTYTVLGSVPPAAADAAARAL